MMGDDPFAAAIPKAPATVDFPATDLMGGVTGFSMPVTESAPASARPKMGDDPFAALIPKAPPTGNEASAFATGMINGIPIAGPTILGGLDRAAAGAKSLVSGTTFADELASLKSFRDRTAKANPRSTTAGEVAGAVVGTAPAVLAAPAAFGAGTGHIAGRVFASALTGGALGGADAAARGQDVGIGAAAGLGLGAASPVVAAGIGKVVGAVASKLRPPAPVPTAPQLKEAANAAYKAADDAGVQIADTSFAPAILDIARSVRDAGFDKGLHPKSMAVLNRLGEAIGTSPSLKDAELLRRVAKGAASSIDPDESRIGTLIVGKIDDYIGGLKPADLVSGDAAAATKALGDARTFWGQAKRSELVEEAVEKAERRAASTGSGGNADNAIRQNVRAILDSPAKRRGFSEAEIAAMEKVVRGGPVQNAARLVGKLAPQGNGLSAWLGLGATAVHPAMIAAPAAGSLAKLYADSVTKRNVGMLEQLIRAGGEMPVSPLALSAREGADNLLTGLLAASPPVANQRR